MSIRDLPSALKDRDLKLRLATSKIAVFLDYDGTLAPVADDPSGAVLSPETRKVLEKLASLCQVIILSGRDVDDVRNMVGLDGITYSGSHGFDTVGRDGKRISFNENWDRFLKTLDAAERKLRLELKAVPGVFVERKRLAIAVHYRKVGKSDYALVKQRFNQVAAEFPSLRKVGGKKVFELLPNVHWNKGAAVLSLNDALAFEPKVLPIFIGDDLTDEDVFYSIRDEGVGIVVGCTSRKSYAQYSLHDYIEVRTFLEHLINLLGHATVTIRRNV